MWKPFIKKKQGFLSKLLEQRKLERQDMQESQFHWKRIHKIEESQDKIFNPTIEHIPAEAKSVYPKEMSVEMRFAAKNCYKAEVFIYAARKDDAPVLVAEGVLTTGGLIDDEGYNYVDEINLFDYWLSNISIANVRDGCARIFFQTHGYNRIFTRLKFNTGTWLVDMVGAVQ